MNWEIAKETMIANRKYGLVGVVKKPSGEVVGMDFIKYIPVEYDFPIAISAQVTTNNIDCDHCWYVELRIAPLKLFMHISTGKIPFNHKEFEKVEKVISLYGDHNRNFNPLENFK